MKIATLAHLETLKRTADIKAKPGTPCFKCGAPLTLPFVLWVGEHELALHPPCALALSSHLLFDAVKPGR